jgi:uncharacterized protein YcfL
MRWPTILTLLAFLGLSGCCSLREGVIVAKQYRAEMPEVYDFYDYGFRYEPSVYWVSVQGVDKRGRERTKEIILFRHDWDMLRVGDHWSRKGGFSPEEAGR